MAEKGGTLNAHTHQVDLHLVAGIAGKAESQLSRLHVKGDWRDKALPARPEPMKGASAAALGALRAILEGRGSLGATFLRPRGDPRNSPRRK